jgi:hypothetical protein
MTDSPSFPVEATSSAAFTRFSSSAVGETWGARASMPVAVRTELPSSGTLAVPPLRELSQPQTTLVEQSKIQAEVPSAFQSNNSVKYETNENVNAISADRAHTQEGDSAKINVGPVDSSKPADIVIGKDGTVSLAKGIADGDKPLKEYNIQVEDGASSAVTEKVVTDLGHLIHAKDKEAVPRIQSGKDASGQDLVSPDFKKDFSKKFDANGEGKDGLPDNPNLPDGGGGGGGGGGDCRPQPKPAPDGNDSPDNVHPPDNDGNGDSSNRGARGLDRFASKLGDMNPAQYGNWLSSVFLPASLLAELGDPPWDPKKVAQLLKEHEGEINKNLDKQIAGLEKQGDKKGAKALGQMKSDFKSAVSDPKKMNDFASSLSHFMEASSHGKASPTDVHAMFNNNSDLEKAVRNARTIEAAKKYDTSRDGDPDLNKIKGENADKLIADLQLPPKDTSSAKPDTAPKDSVNDWLSTWRKNTQAADR